jgi:hypothetical protein
MGPDCPWGKTIGGETPSASWDTSSPLRHPERPRHSQRPDPARVTRQSSLSAPLTPELLFPAAGRSDPSSPSRDHRRGRR